MSGYCNGRIATGVRQRDDALQDRHCRTAKGRCGFFKIYRPGVMVRKRARAQCGNFCSVVWGRYGETSRFCGRFRVDALRSHSTVDTEKKSSR